MTQAYPLQWPDGWARTSAGMRSSYSRFKTTFIKARSDLFGELDRLGASNAVVSSWLPLTNAGLPRADAARSKVADPGVAVYFTYRGRQMVMARDAYDTVHDNLRSIGLAIEHLRGLDRHGGATMMERAFEGFAALPAPDAKPDWKMTLGNQPTLAAAEAKYRELAKLRHPDAPGGSDNKMAELNAAISDARRELR